MTVKLLMDWPDSRDGKNYLAGNLLTTDAGTESGLVAAKMATTTLTGGTAYVPPIVQKQRRPVEAEFDDVTGGIAKLGADRDVFEDLARASDVLTPPSGLGWVPPIAIWRTKSGDVRTDFVPDAHMPMTSAVLYVSPTGNDTTGTGTLSAPYLSIWKAFSVMTQPTTIYVKAGVYNRNNCWKETSPAYDCCVIGYGGQVISSMRWEGGAWTLTTSGTYTAARSTVGNIVDQKFKDTDGVSQQLKKVASQALCEAEAGTWATNGTNIWVHAADGRSPDTDVLVMIDLLNGYVANDKEIYVRGINFEGGRTGSFAIGNAALTAASKVVLDRCLLTYSKGNGVTNEGVGLLILHRCGAIGNLADGFNYHRGPVSLLETKAIEIDCWAVGCGDPTDVTDNDNASTAHEASTVVRVGTVGKKTSGPLFADIGTSKTWNISCVAKSSTAPNVPSQNVAYQALDTAKQWFDGCEQSGCASANYAAAAATQYTRNSYGLAGTPY